jgi:hypothetical protein
VIWVAAATAGVADDDAVASVDVDVAVCDVVVLPGAAEGTVPQPANAIPNAAAAATILLPPLRGADPRTRLLNWPRLPRSTSGGSIKGGSPDAV